MVLALSSPEPPTPEKPTSRIPKRSGSATTPNSARTSVAAATKSAQRTPVKTPGSRISSFGVASTSTPVRSVAVSPTPSSSKANANNSKEQTSAASDKEQILEICRKLQEIL
ncbi:hypothetical protein IWW36_005978 [Coemansia brasiliensis]|uniref:Uncharacterized protein n=1 Tax=Coemansia brasiliensis TaxID=2650707 RepID=A0A9W8I952_9FUNG|nr:hypothetical protein IWW36_005978 [Coemansia brasiliensis]